MCGIAGIHVLDEGYEADLETLAARLLLEIDNRGGDATGYATFGPSGVNVQKASCRAGTFLTGWRGVPSDTRTVILHTRWATQGKAAFPENNHPVSCGSVHVVHNGHISNDATLFDKLGKERVGHVDSEAIPAVLVAAGWDEAGAGLERLTGAFAIAAVDENRPGELLLAKGGHSPLVWFSNDRLLVWASEAGAITDAWRRAMGTPPKPKRYNYALAGDLIRVRGSAIEQERFRTPTIIRANFSSSGWTYTPNTWNGDRYSGGACVVPTSRSVVPIDRPALPKPTELDLGQKLAAALDSLADDRPQSVGVWNGRGGWDEWRTGAYDPGLADVRCGCCDDWTDPLELEEVFGELVCWGCQSELTAAGVIDQK